MKTFWSRAALSGTPEPMVTIAGQTEPGHRFCLPFLCNVRKIRFFGKNLDNLLYFSADMGYNAFNHGVIVCMRVIFRGPLLPPPSARGRGIN